MSALRDLNYQATELCLGLPGALTTTGERGYLETAVLKADNKTNAGTREQLVGWPPVSSSRKNIKIQSIKSKDAAFVKVSMDGAPYLRKVDLNMYTSYQELSVALTQLFCPFATGVIDLLNQSKTVDILNSSEYVPTYEDKDGDWMLVGDVPWVMFVDSCKRVRIMKASETSFSKK